MESHGLPFVSGAATLSSKWFTCCQNGSVQQVQEVHEEVQGRILNARHYMVRSRAFSGPLRPAWWRNIPPASFYRCYRPVCPEEWEDWRRGGRAERTPCGGQIPRRSGRPAGDSGQCAGEICTEYPFPCTPARSRCHRVRAPRLTSARRFPSVPARLHGPAACRVGGPRQCHAISAAPARRERRGRRGAPCTGHPAPRRPQVTGLRRRRTE